MYYRYLGSPLGDLLLAGDDRALHVVSFPEGSRRRDPEPEQARPRVGRGGTHARRRRAPPRSRA